MNVIISADEVKRMANEQMATLPISAAPPAIQSATAYAASRRSALSSELPGSSYAEPSERATQQKQLGTSNESRFLTFLSVDICGSTALRKSDGDGFDRAYELMLRGLGTSVGHFHGSILKTTGDGFIAFVDGPGFTTQCDNTIDLGLTFLVVLESSINPALKSAGLCQLQIRVGADCGEAFVRSLRVPSTGYETTDTNGLER